MKKFLRKTTLFILPIILIIIMMEILLRHIPNDYTYKNCCLTKYANHIETLIFGSSHSYYGINPAYFNHSAFNAAYVSQSLRFDYEIFKKQIDSLPNLKNIILTVSYFTLYGNLSIGGESWRIKNYDIYCGINPYKRTIEYRSEAFGQKLKVNLLRIYSYYIEHNSEITASELGWGMRHSSRSNRPKDLEKSARTAVLRHTEKDADSEKAKQTFGKNTSILQSLVSDCDKRGINVILLTTPAFKSYREKLNLEQLNATVSIACKIASGYDNCRYVNLLDDSTFVESDFYDADHLSEQGAKKLSVLVNEFLNQNWSETSNR